MPARPVLRLIIVLALLAALLFEGYYIFVLRETIDSRNEELKNISVRLQSLKSERDELQEELSSIKKTTGENRDGNTPER
jgi:hypothetical protein